MTGDAADILARIKRLLPARWFNQVAPIRDAIIGGPADLAAWLYSFLYYAYAQMRLATATGPWLDLFANDFLGLNLLRNGSGDAAFRARIRATILQERVTRVGMGGVITTLRGTPPTIFEPWNTGDTGGWDTGFLAWAGATPGSSPGGGWDVACGWDLNRTGWDVTTTAPGMFSGGAGGWGATDMPAQFLITVPPPLAQGAPLVGGWDAGPFAWDGGIGEWTGDSEQGALTEDDILAAINVSKPTGSIAWTQIQ